MGLSVKSLLEAQACFISSKLSLAMVSLYVLEQENLLHLSKLSIDLLFTISLKICVDNILIWYHYNNFTSSIDMTAISGCLNTSPHSPRTCWDFKYLKKYSFWMHLPSKILNLLSFFLVLDSRMQIFNFFSVRVERKESWYRDGGSSAHPTNIIINRHPPGLSSWERWHLFSSLVSWREDCGAKRTIVKERARDSFLSESASSLSYREDRLYCTLKLFPVYLRFRFLILMSYSTLYIYPLLKLHNCTYYHYKYKWV